MIRLALKGLDGNTTHIVKLWVYEKKKLSSIQPHIIIWPLSSAILLGFELNSESMIHAVGWEWMSNELSILNHLYKIGYFSL